MITPLQGGTSISNQLFQCEGRTRVTHTNHDSPFLVSGCPGGLRDTNTFFLNRLKLSYLE